MKEKIYTIPLTEAYEEDAECPFCTLERRLEAEAVEAALGASMMEPDSRIVSNEKGFCRRHFSMLLKQGNALSLALVLDTHLGRVIEKLERTSGKPSGGLRRKGAARHEELARLAETTEASCVICEKLEETLRKFALTFWELYHREEDFHRRVDAGKGFCLPHFALLLRAAPQELRGGTLARRTEELTAVQLSNMKRVNDDVNWFTKKFDYRNQDAPWKNAKDAPLRAVEKLARFVGEGTEKK